MPWWDGGTPAALATWVEAQDRARGGATGSARSTWHEFRYEDLVRDPDTVLRDLCTFLGEDYDPGMAATHVTAAVAVPERKTWHRRTAQPIGADRVSAYRDVLSAEELGLIEHVAGPRMLALGYELPRRDPVPPGLLAEYTRTAAHRRLVHLRRRAWDVVRDARLREPVAAVESEH